MSFLYHRRVSNFEGTTLYPLNQLKEVYPDRYAEAVKKYVDRPEVMQQPVPVLNCLWNDVIHLAALNPHVVDDALRKLGSELSAKRFFCVDPHLLDPAHTVVYLWKYPRRKDKYTPDNFVPYDPDNTDQYALFPDATAEYYRETLEKGERPLLWYRVPHILYKGSIDVSTCPVIEL